MPKKKSVLEPEYKSVPMTKEECKKENIPWSNGKNCTVYKLIEVKLTRAEYVKKLEERVLQLEKELKERPIQQINHYSTHYVHSETPQERSDRLWAESDTRIGGYGRQSSGGGRD